MSVQISVRSSRTISYSVPRFDDEPSSTSNAPKLFKDEPSSTSNVHNNSNAPKLFEEPATAQLSKVTDKHYARVAELLEYCSADKKSLVEKYTTQSEFAKKTKVTRHMAFRAAVLAARKGKKTIICSTIAGGIIGGGAGLAIAGPVGIFPGAVAGAVIGASISTGAMVLKNYKVVQTTVVAEVTLTEGFKSWKANHVNRNAGKIFADFIKGNEAFGEFQCSILYTIPFPPFQVQDNSTQCYEYDALIDAFKKKPKRDPFKNPRKISNAELSESLRTGKKIEDFEVFTEKDIFVNYEKVQNICILCTKILSELKPKNSDEEVVVEGLKIFLEDFNQVKKFVEKLNLDYNKEIAEANGFDATQIAEQENALKKLLK